MGPPRKGKEGGEGKRSEGRGGKGRGREGRVSRNAQIQSWQA